MKRTLYSLCIGSVLLALTASGAPSDRDDVRGKRRGSDKSSGAVTASARSKSTVNAGHRGLQQRSVTRANVQNRSNFRARTSSDAMVTRRNIARQNNPRVTRSENLNALRERNNVTSRERRLTARNDVAVNRERNFTTRRAVRAQNDIAVNRRGEFNTNRTRNIEANRNRNVVVTNNWRGSRFAGRDYAAFRDYRRVYHDRSWYHHNHSRIVFVLGGPWYWNSGYWYPAWGYSDYAYYPYDGPIYTGYATLGPDQVVVRVQEQLARDGYYVGAIDGSFGPMTREALAAFQADHGLAITSTIDRPTLATLGVS